ncbi:MAG: glycosyltransferase family 9 protein [Fusobacteriaceae bacterium]
MKVLIIHTAFIGDIVLSTPLVRKIKDFYPDSEIIYLTNPTGEEILKNNPNISEIIIYDKRGKDKNFSGFVRVAKVLREKKFDMVFLPHRYLRSTLLGRLTGAKIRIGYNNAVLSFLLTKKIKYEKEMREAARLLKFLPEVSIKKDNEYQIEIFPSNYDKEKISSLISKYNGRKIITFAPGSKWFTKNWPIEYYNSVIEYFGNRSDLLLIYVGGKEEKKILINIKENCLDLRGKTSLLELSEILRISDIVVTNDSSPLHISSGFPKPFIIAILGPTANNFGFFYWLNNYKVMEINNLPCRPCGLHGSDRCPKGHFKCMKNITPEMVIKEINFVLAKEN